MLETSLARRAQLGPLALRLGLGAVFIAHAYAKLALFTLPGTVQFFAANGFPGWTAYPVFAAELLGGVALLLGLGTRAVSLALIPIMVGAFATHAQNGWMFTNAGGGWEYPGFLIAALAAQAFVGAGAFALDGARARASAPSPLQAQPAR